MKTVALLTLLTLTFLLISTNQKCSRVIEDFINKPDPTFEYTITGKFPFQGGNMHLIKLTSGTWLKNPITDRNVWTHWLQIYIPDKVLYQQSLLFIGGGSNDRDPPTEPRQDNSQMAVLTNSIVTGLPQIPNQPHVFINETESRKEDNFIAHTWDMFLNDPSNTDIIAQLPMVKAASNSFKVVRKVVKQLVNISLGKFVVAGASKRGWITWLLGAVRSSEISAIIPMVLPLVNNQPIVEHIWRNYCQWPEAMYDYTRSRIFDRLRTPEYKKLMKILDPIHYRRRLTMPKYVVMATGDEFFPLDIAHYFIKKLRGPTYLRNIPNSGHSMAGTDALYTVTSFYQTILKKEKRPRYYYRHRFSKDNKSGRFIVKIPKRRNQKPQSVILWTSTNPEKRDWRQYNTGLKWTNTTLSEVRSGVYKARVSAPEAGYTGYVIEITFPSNGVYPLKFSTPGFVVPNTFPCEKPESVLEESDDESLEEMEE